MFRKRKDRSISNHRCPCTRVYGVLFLGTEPLLMSWQRRSPMSENRHGLYLQNDSESWRNFDLAKISKVLALAFLVAVASPMWASCGIVQQVVGLQVQA